MKNDDLIIKPKNEEFIEKKGKAKDSLKKSKSEEIVIKDGQVDKKVPEYLLLSKQSEILNTKSKDDSNKEMKLDQNKMTSRIKNNRCKFKCKTRLHLLSKF